MNIQSQYNGVISYCNCIFVVLMLFGVQLVRKDMDVCGSKTHVCLFYDVDTETQSIRTQAGFRIKGQCARPVLSQLVQLLRIGPRSGVICPRLFKYIQQHTLGLTANNWVLHLLRPTLTMWIHDTHNSTNIKSRVK